MVTRSMVRLALAASMVGALGGCFGAAEVRTCAAGYVFDATGTNCVPADASVTDGGTDANTDAHVPCNGMCSGATPHCLVMGSTETCVGCAAEGDCAAMASTPHCEMTSHTCVACTDPAQCTSASEAFCDPSHTCQPCTMNTQCAHLTGTGICDMGTCVECTATDQSACASGICLTGTHACAPMGGSTSTCASCTHDTDCHAGQLCVPLTYTDPTVSGAMPQPVGNRCMWRQDAAGMGAPGGDCFAIRPYVRASMLTSVDGTAATVCTFQSSTCEAQAAFRSTNCMTLDAAGDAMCGVSMVHDGVCRMVSATTNRCTVFCLSDDDCPSGVTCDTGASPRVCRFM